MKKIPIKHYIEYLKATIEQVSNPANTVVEIDGEEYLVEVWL